MTASIEQMWSAPGFTVTVTRETGWKASTVHVLPGVGVSTVTGNKRGDWYAGNDPWVAGHEAGHLMKFSFNGRSDMYDIISTNPRRSTPVPGWEGNVMGEFNGVVDDRVRNIIKERLMCK